MLKQREGECRSFMGVAHHVLCGQCRARSRRSEGCDDEMGWSGALIESIFEGGKVDVAIDVEIGGVKCEVEVRGTQQDAAPARRRSRDAR
jgi:hypothetical protein